MRQDILQRLLDLNHEFYQTFAQPFSETRQRLQPGVLQAIVDLAPGTSVLDLGCGNGMLAKTLYEAGHRGTYVGLDSSKALLGEALVDNPQSNATFLEIDLARDNWASSLPGSFDRIFAFAVLHHIPRAQLRIKIVKTIASLMAENGLFIFSVWNFLANPRFQNRILPWKKIDLQEDDLESGDYLLDWKRGGYGLRYVHSFEAQELQILARESAFEPVRRYKSDGKDGKSAEYHIWKLTSDPQL
ncbi:MAG: class I SAM-dependent methyltransferase [Chloroflexi bacterium]|nr:class I SAM-dependent methyltransferase [Chloroflexota bacterium]